MCRPNLWLHHNIGIFVLFCACEHSSGLLFLSIRVKNQQYNFAKSKKIMIADEWCVMMIKLFSFHSQVYLFL